MKPEPRQLLSIVVPVYNEEESLPLFLRALSPVLDQLNRQFALAAEIIFIDDGSRDATRECIAAAVEADPRIWGIVFSRNFGKEAALTAGLAHARGDAVIPVDVDLQDPLELIPEMVGLWREGAETVVAVRQDRDSDSFAKRTTSSLFYSFFNKISQYPIPVNAGDYRLMDRKVVDAVLQLDESNRFMKGLFSWVGFNTKYVYFSRQPRQEGTSSFNYRRLFRFALDGITSFSTLPLRVWSYVGFGIAFLAFIFALWVILKTLLFGDPVQGFPTLMVVILFLGGLNLMGIGILGEYLGRLYQEAKRRPHYIVDAVIASAGERE